MKRMRILCLTAIAAVMLLPPGVRAGEGEFDTEKMLPDMEKQLKVSKKELEKLEKRMEETREKVHKKLFPDG